MTVTFKNFKYTSFRQPANFALVSGIKAPTYGAGPGLYPPAGNWTGIQNQTVDDSFLTVSAIPFTFYHSGLATSTVYIGSNSYLTYGAGSSNFNSLSASNPSLPKYFLGAADNSYQRVSYFVSGTDYIRIRYEGNGSTSGTVGNPGIVYEVTHFNPALFNGNNVIEVLVGKHNRTAGLFGAANSTNYYVTSTIAANQSYVFVGSSTGNNHVLYTGQHISGTDY